MRDTVNDRCERSKISSSSEGAAGGLGRSSAQTRDDDIGIRFTTLVMTVSANTVVFIEFSFELLHLVMRAGEMPPFRLGDASMSLLKHFSLHSSVL